MRRRADIAENLATFTGDTTYTPEDKALLEEFGQVAMQSPAIKKMRID